MQRYEKPKKLPKYVNESEISCILDKAKKTRFRDYVLLLTLWRTGMRNSEVIKLKKEDLGDGQITIWNGKGNEDRVIPLESELDNILRGHADRIKSRDRLFPITDRQLRNIVYKYSSFHYETMKNGKKVKKYKVHPHTFRHSFAVHCLKNGMNLRSLQIILGHSSLTNTQIYLDLIAKDIKEDFKKVVW